MNYLPILDYEGLYEVSDVGEVRSIDRRILGNDGVIYPYKGQLIKAAPNKNVRYMQVSLWKDNKGTWKYVHRLVAQAFIPNPLNLAEVNHLNGNRQDNRVSNLEWVSRIGNAQHAIKTGLKVYTTRLTKAEFIECLQDVLGGESYASLTQRVPYKVPFLSVKVRAIARELGLENELNEALAIQRAERGRTMNVKNY